MFNPKISKELAEMDERIRLARLRRGQSMSLLSDRAGMSRVTLTAIEKGDPGVSLGAYLSVLKTLMLAEDINLIAKDDV